MGRPRQFDEEDVLDRAMELFWRQGYAATSLQELLDHMGISRQSLYNAFGDKHQLFLRCLERYCERHAEEILVALEKPCADLSTIRTFFARFSEILVSSSKPLACMIGKSSMEMGCEDAAVQKRLRVHLCRIEQAFTNAVQNAIDSGQLTHVEDARAVARHLLATAQGIGVLARGGAGPDVVDDALRVSLSVLR